MQRFTTLGAVHTAALKFHAGRDWNEFASASLDEHHGRPGAHLTDREVGS